jgi:hypothetical protein
MPSLARTLPLGALLATPPLTAFAGGEYGSVRLHDDEQGLIDSSKQRTTTSKRR